MTAQGEVFRAIVELSPYLHAVVDAQMRFAYLSPSASDLLGWDPEHLVGSPLADVVHPDDMALAVQVFDQVVAEVVEGGRGGIPMVFRLIRSDGTIVHMEVGARPAWHRPGVQGLILRGRPVSGQHALDRALEALVASGPVDEVLAYLVTSLETELQAATVAIGHGWDGRRFETVVCDPARTHALGSLMAEPGSPWASALASGHTVAARPEELPDSWEPLLGFVPRACWAVPVPVPPDDAVLACIVVWRPSQGAPLISHEVALQRAQRLVSLAFERRHTDALLRHAALHDTLTGIANRAQFFDRLDTELAARTHPAARSVQRRRSSATSGDHLAVLYLDLDGFKPVNDTYGHAAGDALLQVVSRRMVKSVRPGDLVARLGGDEFAVLCPGVAGPGEAEAVARRLEEAIGRPAEVLGNRFTVGVSIGVAVTGDGVDGRASLLEAADRSLYEAKRRPRPSSGGGALGG